MLTRYRRNCLGTLDFTAQFPGMRKPQEFVVYPMHDGDAALRVKVQSDTRIGWVDLHTGAVWLSRPHASGAYNSHLSEARPVVVLDGETLLVFKSQIAATSGPSVGRNAIGMTTDNSAAIKALGGLA